MAVRKVNQVRRGNIVRHESADVQINETRQSKPGKGGAYITLIGKNIHSGKKWEKRFSSGSSVEILELFTKVVTHGYSEGDQLFFFNESGDLFQCSKDRVDWPLKVDMEVSLLVDESDVVFKVNRPKEILGTVISVSGRASAASKDQSTELDNGLRVKTPSYVKIGDKILINGEDYGFVRVVR
jgi:translation elongation factor P/translation initiation factor 5A